MKPEDFLPTFLEAGNAESLESAPQRVRTILLLDSVPSVLCKGLNTEQVPTPKSLQQPMMQARATAKGREVGVERGERGGIVCILEEAMPGPGGSQLTFSLSTKQFFARWKAMFGLAAFSPPPGNYW